jgi:YVTN family beta-propeller protein
VGVSLGLTAALALVGGAHADTLVVLEKSDHAAAFLDLGSGQVVARVATGAGPHEAVAIPALGVVYVANHGTSGLLRGSPGNTLTRIDASTRRVAGTVDLGEHTKPHGLAASRAGSLLWVTTEGSGSVLELDARSGELLRSWKTGQEASHMVVASPDERELYVANIGSGSVTVIERATGSVQSIATGEGSEGLDVSPDGQELWVANRGAHTISVVGLRERKVLGTFPSGGRMPIRVKFTPDGREVWVSTVLSNAVVVFDRVRRERVAEIELDLPGPTPPGPVGLLLTPDGKRAYVAHTTADRVAEIDVERRLILRSFSTGDEPDGLALLREDRGPTPDREPKQ